MLVKPQERMRAVCLPLMAFALVLVECWHACLFVCFSVGRLVGRSICLPVVHLTVVVICLCGAVHCLLRA